MAIALVSSASAGGLNGATTSSIDTTGATLLVIAIAYNTGSPTVSDSKSNTWTAATAYNNGSLYLRYYYAVNPTVGTGHTFTITATGLAPAILAMAFSGADTVTPYDKIDGGSVNSATQGGVGTTGFTPTNDNSLIIAAVAQTATASAFTAGSGWTSLGLLPFSSGNYYGIGASYKVQTTKTNIPNSEVTSSWTSAVNVAVSGIVFKASASSPLAAGTPSVTSSTSTTINVTAGTPTGGTAPYSYQWYRSATSNFTPGVGNIISGATSQTLADSTGLSADTPYYYVCRVTDSASATVDTKQIAGVLKAATLVLGFIGDSITNEYGLSAGEGPATQCGLYLEKFYKHRAVTVSEQAVNGSKSADWISGSTNLNNAKSAFSSAGVTHVHIMLGANDAAAANLVSAATFLSNLTSCVNDLTGAGYKVIISYPTYIPAGANSNATTAASVALAQSYQAQIDSLVDQVNVLRGDTLAFNYFINSLSETQSDKTHPTATGAKALGLLWARAIDRALYRLSTSGGTTRTASVTLVNSAGSAQSSLSSLSWAFWENKTADVLGNPTDSGTGETTDGSGVLSISVRTLLPAGATGWLVVTNSDGNAATAHKAFAGPVVLS